MKRSKHVPNTNPVAPSAIDFNQFDEVVTEQMSYEDVLAQFVAPNTPPTTRDAAGRMFQEMKGKALQEKLAEVSHMNLVQILAIRDLCDDLLSQAGIE